MVTTQLLGRDYFISGDDIDEFTLLEIIGGGGEGGIWSAWDNSHDRIVALKFFQLDDTTRTENKRREELLALASIQHVNICRVFKSGQGIGFLYFVLEYYPSGSLADVIRGQPLAPANVLKISAQIVSALDHIHHWKVIHRDLKPSNILVNYRQQAFLTDFGIARTLSDSTMALHTGQGTPAYSSPEQHTKNFIDVKTDIYSFGVMLYEMCTGEPPWSGLSSLAIKQLEADIEIPDPREMNPTLPAGLHPVLKSLTALNPDERPDSILDAFGMLLTAWSGEELSGFFDGKIPVNLEGVLSKTPPVSFSEQEAFEEASSILHRKLSLWRDIAGQYRLGATQFIYLEDFFRKPQYLRVLSPEQKKFLALFSIVHGRHIAFWWGQITEPADRLEIAENIFANEVGGPVLNLMNLMLVDPGQFADGGAAGEKLTSSVLGLLDETEEPEVIRKAVILLDTLVEEAATWRLFGFSEVADLKFAGMAASGEIYALDAASLLGKVKSTQAVEAVTRAVREDHFESGYQALAVMRQSAGSWPKGIPAEIRMQTWLHLFQDQVFAQRGKFLRMFLLSWLGAGLAFFFYVFTTTRLPSYFVISRILSSIGSGLFFGPIVGVGLTVTKWISRRLVVLSKAGRAISGTILGGLIVNLGFFGFHLLLLESTPTGVLILLGSLLFSAGFGLSEAFSLPKLWQGVISAVFVMAGLFLSFEIAGNIGVSPMLYYEGGEPIRSVLIMFGYSCILGFVAQLFQDAERL